MVFKRIMLKKHLVFFGLDKMTFKLFVLALNMIIGFQVLFSVKNILQICCNALHTNLNGLS